MKKQLLFCLLLLAGMATHAQNWQCVQPTEQPYFTNSNGYLRGMRIDSTVTDGANTIYYPYRSVRGNMYYNIDTSASWMGGKIIRQPDGTFLFGNIWQDTVVVKTAAGLGDSWVFYDDTLSRVYTATVTGIDTGRVAGNLDSIKTITIMADSAGIANPADSANGLQLKLSLNNGFAQVPDLYAFPYKDTTGYWLGGTDYWTELVTNTLDEPDLGPVPAPLPVWPLIFQQVHFHDPTRMEIFDFNVGDVFELSSGSSTIYGDGSGGGSSSQEIDTITSKTVGTYQVSYTSKGIYTSSSYFGGPNGNTSSSNGGAYANGGFQGGDTSHIFYLTALPEEYTLPLGHFYTYYYNPQADTSACSGRYGAGIYNASLSNCSGGSFGGAQLLISGDSYSSGYGQSSSSSYCYPFGPNVSSYTNSITYAKKAGAVCFGTLSPIVLGINDIKESAVTLAPNPVSGTLSVSVGNNNVTYTASLYNMAGQLMLTQKATGNISLALDAMPSGIYTLMLQTQQGSRIMKKVSVIH